MSAIHITAEPGRIYLGVETWPVYVVSVTAHTVTYRIDQDDAPLTIGRSLFETLIESVLE